MAHHSAILQVLKRRRSASRRPVLAICGGGNAGHALAVIASQNFEGDITWLAGSQEKAALLRRGVFSREGLRSTGAIVGRADRVRVISENPVDVIPSADVVLLAVPAYAHASILHEINPFLKPDVLIGSLPTRSGFEFEATHAVAGIGLDSGRTLFGLQTLPWSTRVQEPGKIVNFGAIKAKVLMATMPCRHAPALAAWLSRLLGIVVVPTQNFLNMTLGNPGQVIHPGLMYGHFGAWAGGTYAEESIPRFYADASERIGDGVRELSDEILTVAREVERAGAGALDLSGVLSIHDWLRVSYPTQTQDTSTVGSCFRTGPIQVRKAPMVANEANAFEPNFNYRYLTEDVPFGLAITKGIAQLAHVETPLIDTVIGWAGEKLGKRYLVDSTLCGTDALTLPIPQNYGIDTLTGLIDWYTRGENVPGVLNGVGARSAAVS